MPFPLTVRDDWETAVPLQVGSSGPNRRKVMVPVGLLAPVRTAVSLSWPPTVVGPDAEVTRVGAAAVTVLASLGSRHAVMLTPRLLSSPE